MILQFSLSQAYIFPYETYSDNVYIANCATHHRVRTNIILDQRAANPTECGSRIVNQYITQAQCVYMFIFHWVRRIPNFKVKSEKFSDIYND